MWHFKDITLFPTLLLSNDPSDRGREKTMPCTVNVRLSTYSIQTSCNTDLRGRIQLSQMKVMNLNNLAFWGAWNGTRHILPFHSETRSLLYFTISYNKSIIAVSAARPSGWVEEASITASSRGDRRKSSPPQFSCCSWKISCTWSTGFLQPAGDSMNGSSWVRGRNQQEHTSKLKNAWKSTFGERSCYMVLNRSSERIPQFQWKIPEESYQCNSTLAVNPGHLLCSPHTVTWNCIYWLTWAQHDFRLGLDSLKTTFFFFSHSSAWVKIRAWFC